MGKQVKFVLLRDDGRFPNNEKLPLLLYRGAIEAGGAAPAKELLSEMAVSASAVEATFHRNGWGGSWRNGIYDMHHYHSTAHETLGVYAGSARIQLGGDSGPMFEIRAGDVVVIPAGVAHKRIESSVDFRVVGAYPDGQRPDMCYGSGGERPEAERNIESVHTPSKDPVYGEEGPLHDLWKRRGAGSGFPA